MTQGWPGLARVKTDPGQSQTLCLLGRAQGAQGFLLFLYLVGGIWKKG